MGSKLLDITKGSRLHEPPNIVNVCTSVSELAVVLALLPFTLSPFPVLLKRST